VNIPRRLKIDSRWYLTVRCEKCEMPICFALDHGAGVEGSYLPPHQKLILTCALDECKHRADYTTATVMRFQKQPIPVVAQSRYTAALPDTFVLGR